MELDQELVNQAALTNESASSLDKSKLDEFMVIFKGEALEKLEELASEFEIPLNKLGDVLVKGIHIMDLAVDGKVFIEKGKQRLQVDLKKL